MTMRRSITGHPFRLGAALIDPGNRLVTVQGRARRIAPTPLRLLKLLVDADGEAVSTSRLLEELWPSLDVGHSALYRAICDLRKALGGGKQPKLIVSVPGRGYRLTQAACAAEESGMATINIRLLHYALDVRRAAECADAERARPDAVLGFDVRTLRTSPRHAYLSRVDPAYQKKIEMKVWELQTTGTIAGWPIIISLAGGCPELHCGNPGAIAWMLHARERRLATTFETFARSFDKTVVLQDRRHCSRQTWHPYVLPEVACASRLAPFRDPDLLGLEVRRSVTHGGVPVYFDNRDFYAGMDAAPTLEETVSAYERCRL